MGLDGKAGPAVCLILKKKIDHTNRAQLRSMHCLHSLAWILMSIRKVKYFAFGRRTTPSVSRPVGIVADFQGTGCS